MATIATTGTETEPETGAKPEFPPHRMTIDRYERLVEAGVYGPKDPVFLWKGRLVEKMTTGNRHNFSLTSLQRLMIEHVPGGWFVRQEQPIALSESSMPEPDLTVVRGVPRDYLDRSVAARDVGLVVEVSDRGLAIDSRSVLRAYAAEGIPVYWIVNIPKARIDVHGDPTGPPESAHYREHRAYGPDDEIPVFLDGREVGRIAVRDVLP